MDNVEDSGFDSDPKTAIQNDIPQNMSDYQSNANNSNAIHLKPVRKTELQKKLERQREVSKKAKEKHDKPVDQQPKRSFLLPHARLLVPSGQRGDGKNQDEQPLVSIVSDSSEEDEFDRHTLTKEAHKEITQQLIKDGYNLDLEPDDEDLDLIPPRPLSERYACCNQTIHTKCAIQ